MTSAAPVPTPRYVPKPGSEWHSGVSWAQRLLGRSQVLCFHPPSPSHPHWYCCMPFCAVLHDRKITRRNIYSKSVWQRGVKLIVYTCRCQMMQVIADAGCYHKRGRVGERESRRKKRCRWEYLAGIIPAVCLLDHDTPYIRVRLAGLHGRRSIIFFACLSFFVLVQAIMLQVSPQTQEQPLACAAVRCVRCVRMDAETHHHARANLLNHNILK